MTVPKVFARAINNEFQETRANLFGILCPKVLMDQSDLLQGLSEELKEVVSDVLEGKAVGRDGAYKFTRSTADDLGPLCHAASFVRTLGKGTAVSFSPKVFIPLTRMCRDSCSYCTFRQGPQEAERLYMSPDEVVSVAQAGERLGCTEALFTLGERPEQRYPEAKDWLNKRGYKTTVGYLRDMCELVIQESSLSPHANPGTMSHSEMKSLSEVNVSMGLMLENVSERLYAVGGPHEFAPSKRPKVRLKSLKIAGELKVAFTTGILIGIGETYEERIESILAIRSLQKRFGHIQEVIVQNFRRKPNTAMAMSDEPSTRDLLWTVAVTRLLLGADMNIQVPPNLNASDYDLALLAGINDWGGISPLTIDYVNPESPWPQMKELRDKTESLGFTLRPRLPVYPEFINASKGFLPTVLRDRTLGLVDDDGYAKGGIDRYVGRS